MKITINPQSYVERPDLPCGDARIEAFIDGRKRHVYARRMANGDIYLEGFIGRYNTSGRAWPATVVFVRGKGKARVSFGRGEDWTVIDKASLLTYDPETYCQVHNRYKRTDK